MIRIAAPLAVLAVVVAVFFGERMSIDHQLQLRAPLEAAPGDTLPVQVILVGDLEALDGPHLMAARTLVRVVQGDRTLAEETLEPAAGGGAVGTVPLPDEAFGDASIVAVAWLGGDPVASATRRLRIVAEPEATPTLGRLAGDLQRARKLAGAGVGHVADDPRRPRNWCGLHKGIYITSDRFIFISPLFWKKKECFSYGRSAVYQSIT